MKDSVWYQFNCVDHKRFRAIFFRIGELWIMNATPSVYKLFNSSSIKNEIEMNLQDMSEIQVKVIVKDIDDNDPIFQQMNITTGNSFKFSIEGGGWKQNFGRLLVEPNMTLNEPSSSTHLVMILKIEYRLIIG